MKFDSEKFYVAELDFYIDSYMIITHPLTFDEVRQFMESYNKPCSKSNLMIVAEVNLQG